MHVADVVDQKQQNLKQLAEQLRLIASQLE